MKTKKSLRIGLDLDGVILDNPIKMFRIFAKKLKFIKPFLFKQKKELFYYPKSKIEKFFWWLIHKTSWRINPHLKELKKLIKEKKIEAYIITGRYSFLEKDFLEWLKKIKKMKIFKNFYFNKEDIQPNEFKLKMIKKLNLDIFIEDNLDIVEKLNSKSQAKIFWITNFFDQLIPYKYKYKNLKEVITFLKKYFKKEQ